MQLDLGAKQQLGKIGPNPCGLFEVAEMVQVSVEARLEDDAGER